MTWQPPARTAAGKAIYAAAEQDRVERPERYRLDADMVVERALRRDGVAASMFADGWRTGLDHFLRSADQEGRLNAVGARMALQTAAGRLMAGATITRHLDEHPEIADTPIAPPIVIVGGWRTGTTFLFRLLGSDPRLHAPLPAELVSPWLFAGPNRLGNSEITSAASQLLHTLNPDMTFVHPSGPTLPEECVLGMGTDLRNWGFTSMLRLPSYANWLAGQDFTGTYARYRDVLRLLAFGDSRRFVLKAPAHTAELDHLIDTFPRVVVVEIHRDIVDMLTSGTSLFALYQSTYSDDVQAAEVARQQMDQTELWLRRARDVRSSVARDAATFVDLDYRDLIERPADSLSTIYTAADMDPPAEPDQFADAYRNSQPRDTHGRHHYRPDDFGIDTGEMRERFSFLTRG